MKNNIVVVLLVVLISVVSGFGLLYGINNAVSVAIAPIAAKVGEIALSQKHIEAKLASGQGADASAVMDRLNALEDKLGDLKKLAAAPQDQADDQQPQEEDYSKVYALDAGTSPIIGNPQAPVTIVKFSDFQCPFCHRFFPPVKDILKAYPQQVRLIIKNYPLPFHPNARPAAKLALAANVQGKYFEAVDILLANGANVSDDKIKEYAKTIGLDANKWMDDYKNKDAEWEKQVEADMALAEQSDVRGTPTFFINGKKTMARDFNGFKAEVEKILAEKK